MADSAAETGQETMGQLLKDFHPNVRSIIRRTEKIWRKIKKKEISVVFNEFCIKESLLPKYTIFKLHDPAAKHSTSTTEFRRELVLRQITSAKNDIEHLNEEFEEIKNALKKKLHADDYNRVYNCIQQVITKENLHHRQQILNKLCRLYNGNILLPNYQDNYINLSKLELTKDQEDFLNLGPNCHLKNKYDPLRKKKRNRDTISIYFKN